MLYCGENIRVIALRCGCGGGGGTRSPDLVASRSLRVNAVNSCEYSFSYG